MDACCANKAAALEQMHERQSQTLRLVLWINAVMFGAEFVAGVLAGSVALMADSLDMLTDALVYGLSLYVVRRGAAWKARAALTKAAVMALFGLFVFAAITTPDPGPFGMTVFALCLSLLYFIAVGVALINDRRKGRGKEIYAGIDDDETSSLEGYDAEPVEAGPQVSAAAPLDRRFDEMT